MVGGAGDLDLVQGDIQRTAALQAGAFFLVREVDGDADLDLLVGVDAIEVEVPRLIRHRMHVDGLGDHRLRFGAVLQGHQVTQQLAGVEGLAELVGLHGDRHGGLVAAVEHARHQAGAASDAGAAGSRALTHFDVQYNLGHGPASETKPPRERRAATQVAAISGRKVRVDTQKGLPAQRSRPSKLAQGLRPRALDFPRVEVDVGAAVSTGGRASVGSSAPAPCARHRPVSLSACCPRQKMSS